MLKAYLFAALYLDKVNIVNANPKTFGTGIVYERAVSRILRHVHNIHIVDNLDIRCVPDIVLSTHHTAKFLD
jgi:hypothetical protein